MGLWQVFADHVQGATNPLYAARDNWLDPRDGRWLTQDAVRADEENLYRYAGNDPVNNVEPSGLDEIRVLDAVGGRPPAAVWVFTQRDCALPRVYLGREETDGVPTVSDLPCEQYGFHSRLCDDRQRIDLEYLTTYAGGFRIKEYGTALSQNRVRAF